jgi:hypothetical protein
MLTLRQCFRGKKVVPTWERTLLKAFPQDRDAVLTLAHEALPFVTKMVMTLTLHRIRQHLRLPTDACVQLSPAGYRCIHAQY